MDESIRVLVINGSPKGDYSLTLQHSRYMLGQETNVEWKVLQAGEALSPIQFSTQWLEAAMRDIEWADAILWNTPVYTMLVPWQLIRLVQLIRQAGRPEVFLGKYATSMMTCFHYYDHLAEDWLRATSEDLGMAYMEGRTADNMDMLKKEHRAGMHFFMHEFLEACRSRAPLERKFAPLTRKTSPVFTPVKSATSDEDGKLSQEKQPEQLLNESVPRTVLLTDEYGKDGNLSRMIEVFAAAYPHPIEVVDINDFPYESGCHGCLRCELVGECDRKDGFQDFYMDLVNTCDVLVFGMNLEERYLRPVWKLFLDRTFSNGHRTSMMGKHTAYLVAGPLRSLPNVRQFLEGKDNVGRENAMAIIGDEGEESAQLQALLEQTALRLARATAANYQKSVNFLGLGGLKLFRDLIYSMRGVVPDDHRFYKSNGLYDFPQKNIPRQFFNLGMGAAFQIKAVRVQAFERMPALYIKLHEQIVKSGKP